MRLVAWEERWPGLSVGFSTRFEGNLAFLPRDDDRVVIQRRQKLAEVLGFSFSGMTFAQQVHGTRIQAVDDQQRGRGNVDAQSAIPGTDGFSTQRADTVLSLFFADCVPLYFYAPDRRVLALAHAGWRGTTGNIATRMLKHLQQTWGIRPETVWVAIGPSIGGCCYQVDAPVVEAVRSVWPDVTDTVCRPQGEGRWLLDLKELNQRLLMAGGVPTSHIWVSQYCTSCRHDLFYSYRKEGLQAGRMLAWIGRKEGNGR